MIKNQQNKITVFAGQDKEATQTMREYIQQVPSSPSYALFKGTELKHFILENISKVVTFKISVWILKMHLTKTAKTV